MTIKIINKEEILRDMDYERGVIEYSNKIAEILTDGTDIALGEIDKFVNYINSFDGDKITLTVEEKAAYEEQVASYANKNRMLDEILEVIKKYQ